MEGCAYVQSFCFSFAERLLTKDLPDQYCWALEFTAQSGLLVFVYYIHADFQQIIKLFAVLFNGFGLVYNGTFQIYIWKRELLVDTESGQTAQVCIYLQWTCRETFNSCFVVSL